MSTGKDALSTQERTYRVERMGVGVNVLIAAILLFCGYTLNALQSEQKNTNDRLQKLADKVEESVKDQAVLKALDLHSRLVKVEMRLAGIKEGDAK